MAFVNAGNPLLMKHVSGINLFTYGEPADADYPVRMVEGPEMVGMEIQMEEGRMSVSSRLYGSYNFENLAAAAAGEKMEWGTLYPSFAADAEKEGFPDIARLFRTIAKVEARHEARYTKLHANMENGRVFSADRTVKWYCRNCGYIHEGRSAPATCPACDHPQAYFEPAAENY